MRFNKLSKRKKEAASEQSIAEYNFEDFFFSLFARLGSGEEEKEKKKRKVFREQLKALSRGAGAEARAKE